jgi:hypothetical protein
MMKIYLCVSAGLLVAATITSALLDNWDTLVGVGLGLASVLFLDFLMNWSSQWRDRYSEETERHREALIGKRPVQTTYYYGDEEDSEASPPPEANRAAKAKPDWNEQAN